MTLLRPLYEIDKKFRELSHVLTGETQLRAKRTRIKILRAIADRNGSAGFSDIKVSTGLSTGSIYYHLERMGLYVTKDSKQYLITEEGLQLLREVDVRYKEASLPRRSEQESQKSPIERSEDVVRNGEESLGQSRFRGLRNYAIFAVVGLAAVLAGMTVNMDWRVFSFASIGVNPGLISLVALAAALALSWSLPNVRKYTFPVIGYRGIMVSVLCVAALFVGVPLISDLPFTGASSQTYDNSMDALISSYSLHWHVR
ncbi:MAG: winged helix-turn-helix domain-containing protein [Nitrososphaera sp.]|nr:winged helix-turn-helix domain-containing protein [Nitrososphaera sp.]